MIVKIEIWSDIACPWCYIGKRRFESALSRFPHRDAVEVEWKSFELNPDYPAGAIVPIIDFVTAHKGITTHEAQRLFAEVSQIAAREGLRYDFASAQHSNTFDAHRVLHYAKEHSLQGELKERLLSAYFERGEAVGDHATLAAIAAEIGLNPREVEAVLASSRYADEVRADELEARQLGLHGVPAFVLDRRFVISGAQSSDIMLNALSEAWNQRPIPLVLAGAAPAVCDADACAF